MLWGYVIIINGDGGCRWQQPKEKEGKEEYLHSAICILCISQKAQAWII